MSSYSLLQGDTLVTGSTVEGSVAEAEVAKEIDLSYPDISADNPVEVSFMSAIGPKRGFVKSGVNVEQQLTDFPVQSDHTGIDFKTTDPEVFADYDESAVEMSTEKEVEVEEVESVFDALSVKLNNVTDAKELGQTYSSETPEDSVDTVTFDIEVIDENEGVVTPMSKLP